MSLGPYVHHKPLVYLVFRTSKEKTEENEKKPGSDPPNSEKKKRRLHCWHLLKIFKLSYKDKAILSSFGEGSLRPAIDDLKWLKKKKGDEAVTNEIAFLISRCKHHKEKVQKREELEKPCSPEEALVWLKDFLSSKKKKLKFIEKPNDINRSSQEKKPLIMLRQSLEASEKSIFRIYQKVRGTWTDRDFTFDRPDFKRAVTEYFEDIFKAKREYSYEN